jgi:bifunctional non-homologous end joining protein LigD
MKKDLRPGKVFIDWSQNDEHKTTVSGYSLRARPQPTVSLPLGWEELQAWVEQGQPENLVFMAGQAVTRVQQEDDLFSGVLTVKQQLPGV